MLCERGLLFAALCSQDPELSGTFTLLRVRMGLGISLHPSAKNPASPLLMASHLELAASSLFGLFSRPRC